MSLRLSDRAAVAYLPPASPNDPIPSRKDPRRRLYQLRSYLLRALCRPRLSPVRRWHLRAPRLRGMDVVPDLRRPLAVVQDLPVRHRAAVAGAVARARNRAMGRVRATGTLNLTVGDTTFAAERKEFHSGVPV